MNQFNFRSSGGFTMFPPVIKMLLILNVGIFLIVEFFIKNSGIMIDNIHLLYYIRSWFAMIPMDGVQYTETFSANFWPWQLVSYQFFHAGFGHLFFNMFALWMFGIELENQWGSRRFIIFYLLSGIGAGIIQYFVATGPTIGASGAVLGVLAAFGYSFPDRKLMMFPLFIPIKAKYFVIGYALIDLISGFTTNDDIAHFAHVAGAATGFLLMKYGEQMGIYNFFEKIINSFKTENTPSHSAFSTGQRQEAKVHKMNWGTKIPNSNTKNTQTETRPKGRVFIINGEEITQNKIDDILDKISASGYQNLTEKEKFILNEISKQL